MNDQFSSRGFVIEVQDLPRWLPRALETGGFVHLASRTIDGLYCEPTTSLDDIFGLLEEHGRNATAVRYAGTPASWHEGVKAARSAERRLRNRRAAEWLPAFRTA